MVPLRLIVGCCLPSAGYLFGEEAGKAPERGKKKPLQTSFFDLKGEDGDEEQGWGDIPAPPPGATVLDRLHQCMILFGANRGDALRRFLVDDGVGEEGRRWCLAQAFSALYPAGSEEKRWVDGVLARTKSLGF